MKSYSVCVSCTSITIGRPRLKNLITSSNISFSVMVQKQPSVPRHTISHRPLTKEDQFPFQASSYRICSGQSDTVVISLRVLLFLPSASFLQCFTYNFPFTHIRAYIVLAVDSVFEENIAVTSTVAEHVISAFCISTLCLCD
jgi:hypothetical protein